MTISADIQKLTSELSVDGQDITIRPISPDDIALEKAFVENLSPQSRHFRFLGGIQHLSDANAKSLCEIDFDKTMAFIAVTKGVDGSEQELGVSRYASDSVNDCEFAITVADDWQNHGLGRQLMDKLIDFARSKGKTKLYSLDLADNSHMRELAQDLNMSRTRDPGNATMVRHELALA